MERLVRRGALREASCERDEPEAVAGDAAGQTFGGVSGSGVEPRSRTPVRRPRVDDAHSHSGCLGTPPWDHYESCAGSSAR